MAYKRLSSAVLLGVSLLGLTGQQVVMAEETNNQVSEQTTEFQYSLGIPISSRMRSDQTAIDVAITLPKKFETTKVATVELKNLVGDVLNTLEYTVPKGDQKFNCWFSLTGLQEDGYYTTVSLPDGPLTHFGYSKTIYTQEYKPMEILDKNPTTETSSQKEAVQVPSSPKQETQLPAAEREQPTNNQTLSSEFSVKHEKNQNPQR